MYEFGTADEMFWRGEAAWLTVLVNRQTIRCAISKEAIEDHFGDQPNDGACLDAAMEHFDEITDEIGHKIATGNFEPDGTILLRTQDW